MQIDITAVHNEIEDHKFYLSVMEFVSNGEAILCMRDQTAENVFNCQACKFNFSQSLLSTT